MKATIEFNLDNADDVINYKLCNNSFNMAMAIDDIENELRQFVKYDSYVNDSRFKKAMDLGSPECIYEVLKQVRTMILLIKEDRDCQDILL